MRGPRDAMHSKLIERDRETALLDDLVERGRAGNGGVLVLEGPAGIGKSRLCAEVAEMAANSGMTVLTAHGGELEGHLTYGVCRQLFERMLAQRTPGERDALLAGSAHLALSALGSPLTDGDSSATPAEMSIAHGLYWLVSNLAVSQPLALVVDDAHWADAASLRALVYLARRIDGLPVALIVAARTHEPGGESEFIEMLADDRLSRRLQVAPLSEAGCSQLLAAQVARPLPSSAGHACFSVSGGNPFYVGELAGLLSQLDISSDPLQAIRSSATGPVTRSVTGRIRKLGKDAETVSEALSAAGDHAGLGLLASVSGLQPSAVAGALDRLAEAGLVTIDAGPAFRHPILRTAVYQHMPPGRQAQLHSDVAQALTEDGAPLEDIANHLLLTPPTGKPAVASVLREAARRSSMRNAPADAASLLERAAAEPPEPALRSAVLAELGEAQLLAGDAATAVRSLRASVANLDSLDQLRTASIALSMALLTTEGPRAAVSALEQLDVQGDRELALRLNIEQATMGRFVPELLPRVQPLISTFASLPGATPNERLALSLAAVSSLATGTAASVGETTRRALGEGALMAEQTVDSPYWGMSMVALVFCENLDAADREIDRAFAHARERGSAFGFAAASIMALMSSACRGDLVTAIAHGESLLSAQWESRLMYDAIRVATFHRWLVEALLERGELEQAHSVLAQALALGGDLSAIEWNLVRYARGLCRLAEGDAAGALADFVRHGEACAEVGYDDRLSPWRNQAALASLALGRQADAIELADQALKVATDWGTLGGIGASQRVRALAGPGDEAVERLRLAVETLAASHFRLEHSRALVDYGSALRRSGQRIEARPVLEHGLDLAARSEATPLIARAQQELRVIGARPKRLRTSGLESLTASERRVAQMAADGSTNREIAQSLFITLKTVEGHLSQVFRKLGVRSRTALPTRLGQLD